MQHSLALKLDNNTIYKKWTDGIYYTYITQCSTVYLEKFLFKLNLVYFLFKLSTKTIFMDGLTSFHNLLKHTYVSQ